MQRFEQLLKQTDIEAIKNRLIVVATGSMALESIDQHVSTRLWRAQILADTLVVVVVVVELVIVDRSEQRQHTCHHVPSSLVQLLDSFERQSQHTVELHFRQALATTRLAQKFSHMINHMRERDRVTHVDTR